MNVLVTGAGGMVGSHMVETLWDRGINVCGTYYRPTTDIRDINPAIELIECDVRYPQRVSAIVGRLLPDKIFHLAAQSYPTVSWERPQETMDINVGGTVAIFEAVKSAKALVPSYDPMVVVACSSAEYGQTLNELKNPFVLETAELRPLHPYGVSKVAQDLLAYQYYMNDHIRCIRARIFNSTGTRKVNDATSDFTKRAIEAERLGKRTMRVGNLETRRAIMDQRDLIEALILLSDKGVPGEAYNISSEHIYKMSDVIRMIELQIGFSFDLVSDKSLWRPTDERIIVGDVTKLKVATGWEQSIPMERTVADMLDFWRHKLNV